jgi:hypothetical protein
MNNLDKDFVKYPEALELKQLGFQARCFGHYWENLFYFKTTFYHPSTMPNSPESCLVPTYSQAFRWFREKYKLGAIVAQFGWGIENEFGQIIHDISDGKTPSCYEEAELACLKKLIEIVKEKQK